MDLFTSKGESAIRQRLQAYLQVNGVPGASLAVVNTAGQTLQLSEGNADFVHGVPMTTKTLFAAGSITKTITALIFLLLEDEGLLHLDDPVSAWYPQVEEGVCYLQDDGASGETPLLLRHLLSQSSGIPELGYVVSQLFRVCGVADQGPYAIEDVEGMFNGILQAAPLRWQRPGKQFLYSNENFVLLARIAEQVTGEQFATIVQKRIFAQLGMQQSSIGMNPNMQDLPRISGSIPGANGPIPVALAIPPGTAGPGGLLSTIEDMSRYMAFLLGRISLNGRDISRYAPILWNKVVPKNWVPGLWYGTGWYIQDGEFDEPLIYHGGDLLYSGGICALLPKRGIGIVLGQNSGGSPALSVLAHEIMRVAIYDNNNIHPNLQTKNKFTPDLINGTYHTQDQVYHLSAEINNGLLQLRLHLPGVGDLPPMPFAAVKAGGNRMEFLPAGFPPPQKRSGCVFLLDPTANKIWLQYENSLFMKSIDG